MRCVLCVNSGGELRARTADHPPSSVRAGSDRRDDASGSGDGWPGRGRKVQSMGRGRGRGVDTDSKVERQIHVGKR